MATIILIYGFLGICLIVSVVKSKEKTIKAFRIAGKAEDIKPTNTDG